MTVAVLVAGALGLVGAQHPDDSHLPNLPDPVPPPLPREPPPEDASDYDRVLKESDVEWGLPADLLGKLERTARIYQAVLQSFTCDESVRRAEYGSGGNVTSEKRDTYGYLLVKDPLGEDIRESRREFTKNGQLRAAEVEDREPFPPAYEWVFLFSAFHQPLFSYRHLGQHFDGFDVVHEIEFKGALPFTNGRDIRQWEGRVLVDAFTFTPLEVIAEPTGQRDRLRQMFDHFNRSFNVFGVRTAERPLGYKAKVQFGYRKQLGGNRATRLTFPTQLRYDTQRAVGPQQVVPVRASTRTYTNYKFFTTEISDDIFGDVAATN